MKLFFLFANFFKIGLFSVGGGYAIIPFLFEMADKSHAAGSGWLTREMVGNMLAVAQSLPGAIGANLSAYTGIHYGGVPAGFIAAFGLVAPAVIVIMIVARTLKAFKGNTLVNSLFAGFRPAAAGLLSAATLGALSLSLWHADAPVWYEYLRWKETLIFIVSFFLIYKFKKHPILYIAAAGVVGVVLKL